MKFAAKIDIDRLQLIKRKNDSSIYAFLVYHRILFNNNNNEDKVKSVENEFGLSNIIKN